jgi:hypothetical protein
VVELTTSAEATEGADSVRAVTAKAIKEAVAAWLDARFGANNAGIWHPGKLTAEQFHTIRSASLFILPEAIAVLGVFTWWSRRHPGE